MKKRFVKFQFLIFSVLTILLSILLWYFAKEQSGTIKMLLTQFGYFAPAFVAIVLTTALNQGNQSIKLRSYMPFFAIVLCIIGIATFYGDQYYQMSIDQLLIKNPLISIIILVTLIYFIVQIVIKNDGNSVDKLVNVPKTNMIWYVFAIGLYPVSKLFGLIVSTKLFPTQIEMSDFNWVILLPLFLFSVIFYAGIGEEVGWRGFALAKLQRKYNPFLASIFIGIVWSIWHTGYFTLVENYPLQNIPSVVIWTFIASFLSTWFFNKTNGNVLILILFHASVNFAILFNPHPVLTTLIHTVLLIIAFSTGKFFKKVKAGPDA